jgi:signal peptidase II
MNLRLLALLLLSLTLVGCDHATKELALAQFRDTPFSLFSGSLTFTYAENRDMAFGLLGSWLDEPTRRWLLSWAKGLAVVGGAVFLWSRRQEGSWRELLAVTFVVAGASGNLVDRMVRGYVIDFLRVPHWPVFNVADVLICVGYGLFFLGLTRAPQLRELRAQEPRG